MAATDVDDVLMTVPADLVRRCKGLAFDSGGSVFKVIYRSKADLDQLNSTNGDFGRLRVKLFKRDEIKEGVDYARQRAHLSTTSDCGQSLSLSATGVGSIDINELIVDMLNARVESVVEFVCFVKSFNYLAARMPRHLLLEPFQLEAITEPLAFFRSQQKLMAQLHGKKSSLDTASDDFLLSTTGRPHGDEVQPPVEAALSEAEPDMYPCILVICGSGLSFHRVEKDGSFQMLDSSCRCGKAFVGIGKLLTGCTTFDELIDLASKGNPRNVNLYTDEVFSSKSTEAKDENMYSTTEEAIPGLVYFFGKAANGQGDFNREDVAATWLQFLIHDMSQILGLVCMNNGIKRVFFSGGFVSHPVVRYIVTKELTSFNMFNSQLHQENRSVTFDFIKQGQCLGALGCLINDIDKQDGDSSH